MQVLQGIKLMDKKLFLLGGYDLEMIEIKKILEAREEKFYDNKLSWGAKLSDYNQYLNFEGTIYGIELDEDIAPPQNYIAIDHHGKNNHKKSSLEQIAYLFGLELTREQKLIAVNDARYIQGMQSLCASQDEIEQVRSRDREAQGLTQQDLEDAKKLLSDNGFKKIIYAPTQSFTCLSDLMHETDSYIIYSDSQIAFYGYNIKIIQNFFATKNITATNYYYGGGNYGFIIVKDGLYTKDEIENFIKEFTNLENTNKETISHHIFMLPFGYKDKDKVLKKIWGDISNQEVPYNEQAYFHKFFINSMYKNCEIYQTNNFKTLQMQKSELYRLDVEKIQLRLFDDFKVGILSFHLENKTYSRMQEILEINDYTRRIYPEYFDNDKECAVVPDFIKLDSIEEDFAYPQQKQTPQLSRIIKELIGDVTSAVDDRMFTISYCKKPDIIEQLQANYKCNDIWYEYIFVDGDGKTVQNLEMQKELIQKATYRRWQDYGTMYGMSKYSFVCMANSDFPLEHMKTMYFSMFGLLLMVRATLLKFADDVSQRAQDIDTKDISDDVSRLYKDYIKFINKYYFREVTAKDQGIELYEQALDILKIERDIKDLDNEISELFKYVELQSNKRTSEENKKLEKKLNKIQTWGGYLLFTSVATGFFGMNVGHENTNFSWYVVIFTFVISIAAAYKLFNKED